ncbi:phosphatidylglycerophosphatase A [bacterium]|nr:phosphatidylglycerophosphatase A [bacterium]
MKNGLFRFLATGAGSGYCPVAPGTAGSLLAAALVIMLPGFRGPVLAAAVAGVFFIGVAVSTEVEKSAGHDASIIVIDEMVGTWTAMLFISGRASVLWLVAAVILFRIFDIRKPFPVDRLQRLPRGWGVMADDLAAGVMAGLAVRLVCGAVTGGTG